MNTPRFTIVTCTYNAAATLPLTLRSVAAQQHAAIEHLIIDGQSADETLAQAQAYQQECREKTTDCYVVILSEPDRGLYDAMNKALDMATGDYILYLNAGDTLASDTTLSDIARDIEGLDPMPAVIYGNTLITDMEGHILRERRLQPPEKLSWRSFQQGMLVCHQAFYARLDIARECPYDLRYHYSADVDWCIRVMKDAARQHLPLFNTRRVVAHYLEEGLTTANHQASLRERFNVMRRHYGLPTTLLMHIWFAIRSCFKR